jgi:hypothetical protein
MVRPSGLCTVGEFACSVAAAAFQFPVAVTIRTFTLSCAVAGKTVAIAKLAAAITFLTFDAAAASRTREAEGN